MNELLRVANLILIRLDLEASERGSDAVFPCNALREELRAAIAGCEPKTDSPLPCPFCGNVPTFGKDADFGEWWIACEAKGCPAGGVLFVGQTETREEALTLWNTRRAPSVVSEAA